MDKTHQTDNYKNYSKEFRNRNTSYVFKKILENLFYQKQKKTPKASFLFLVAGTGVEPVTSGL